MKAVSYQDALETRETKVGGSVHMLFFQEGVDVWLHVVDMSPGRQHTGRYALPFAH